MLMEHHKHVKKSDTSEETGKLLQEKESELAGLKKELEETVKKLEEADKQAVEAKDKVLRAYADFDNAKKRLAKEREEFVRFSSETMMRGLLPILDNFERAIAHAASGEDTLSPLRDGIVLIKKQLVDFLTQQGLARLETVGKSFDPHVHEAIGHIDSAEHPDETVLEEIEPGYLLHGRLLRPAKVRISKRQEPGQA